MSINRTREFFKYITTEASSTHNNNCQANYPSYSNDNEFHFKNSQNVFVNSNDILDEKSIPKNEFTTLANDIENQLKEISERNGKLENLVKYRGVFEDYESEIQTETYKIRQSIVNLSNQLELLTQLINSRGTQTNNVAAHYKSIEQNLRSRLGQLTIQLKQILEIRAEKIKEQQSRRHLYSHHPIQNSANYTNDSNEISSTLQNHASQCQEYEMGHISKRSTYYSDRTEAVESIQNMIGELAYLVNKVATLVTTQEELTIRIEDDMTIALDNIKKGEVQLEKYLESLYSNRNFIFKVSR